MNEILSTIRYYDIFDYPLTIDEIYNLQQSLDNKKNIITKEEVISYLQLLIKNNIIETSNNLYYLKGKNTLIQIRKEKENNTKEKWNFLEQNIQHFLKIPFLRAVFASGSLSMFYMSKNSDLDIFLICKHGKIFTARFFTYIYFKLYKKIWLNEGENATKFCLNHWISDKNLTLQPQDHIYEARLYSQFYPIYGIDIYQKFIKQNQWIKNYIPLYPDGIKIIHNKIPKNIKQINITPNILEKILDTPIGYVFELIVKYIQLIIFYFHSKKYTELKKQGFLKMTDYEMRFHTHPIRLKVDKKLKEYNNEI